VRDRRQSVKHNQSHQHQGDLKCAWPSNPHSHVLKKHVGRLGQLSVVTPAQWQASSTRQQYHNSQDQCAQQTGSSNTTVRISVCNRLSLLVTVLPVATGSRCLSQATATHPGVLMCSLSPRASTQV
jgi:hypothetical protein